MTRALRHRRHGSNRLMWPIEAAVIAFIALFVAPSAGPRCSGGDGTGLVDLRFRIAGGVDCVAIPVFVGSDRRLFLVDTGTAVTVVDSSLREMFGKSMGFQTFTPPTGPKNLELFEAPFATLAGRRLSGVSKICCADLSNMRALSGCELYGILGMDFLRQRIMRIDFDAGHLDFLRSLPKDVGAVVPLVYYKQMLPSVRFKIKGIGDAWFIIDTGDVGYDAGSIEPRLFQYLLENRHGVPSADMGRAASLEENLSDAPTVRLGATELGGFRHRALEFPRSGYNVLGIGYLSRFSVIFDFPGKRMYLTRGNRFDEPSLADRAGLDLSRAGTDTRVDAVDKGSAAETAGVRQGDVICSIDSADVDSLSIFKIMDLLRGRAKHVLRIQRGEHRFDLAIIIPRDDLAATKRSVRQPGAKYKLPCRGRTRGTGKAPGHGKGACKKSCVNRWNVENRGG